jgi:hypothetical protein
MCTEYQQENLKATLATNKKLRTTPEAISRVAIRYFPSILWNFNLHY